MIKNIWQRCKQIWTRCFSVVTYDIGSRYICKLLLVPWRRGAVDIASASGTRRPVFESRQGIRLLGKHSNDLKLIIHMFVC
jgi:hypothetical protein